MKTKLLSKVKKSIYISKIKRYDRKMFKISTDGRVSSINDVFCTDFDTAVDILREARLEAARAMFPQKKEKRLRI